MKLYKGLVLALLLAHAGARILKNKAEHGPPANKAQESPSEAPVTLSDRSKEAGNQKLVAQDQQSQAAHLPSRSLSRQKPKVRKAVKVDPRQQTKRKLSSKHRPQPSRRLSRKQNYNRFRNQSGPRPERKLLYVVNKDNKKPADTKFHPPTKPANAHGTRLPTPPNRGLGQQKPKAQPPASLKSRPVVNSKPVGRATSVQKLPVKAQAAQPGLKKSFVVTRQAMQKVRKLQQESEGGQGKKLESIPLLLFGDYEIIIEKK